VSGFPGGTAVSIVSVYDWPTADGQAGGSPHLHTASTEGYVVTRGSGAVETLSSDGYRRHDLERGTVLWFTPGTVHRLVNGSGDLELVVVMQNAGIPEAGDAVFTFPEAVLADPDAYRAAASAPPPPPRAPAARAHRRPLAVPAGRGGGVVRRPAGAVRGPRRRRPRRGGPHRHRRPGHLARRPHHPARRRPRPVVAGERARISRQHCRVVIDRAHVFLEHDLLGRGGTDHLREPAQMGWAPGGPAGIADVVSEQKGFEPKLGGLEIADGIFTRAGEVPNGLVLDLGNIDGCEVA
jgi:mannose-6-phosphate isomerase-like protein (cupin superfamily)